MPQDDATIRASRGPGRFNIEVRSYLYHRAPRQTGKLSNSAYANRYHHIKDAWSQYRHNQKCKQYRRERKQNVHRSHHDCIASAAKVAAYQAKEDPNGTGYQNSYAPNR
jgi:hypothetical protein